MKKTVKEIAQLVNGEVVGDPNIIITGLAGIDEAKKGEITFISNPKYTSLLNTTEASCVIASKNIPIIKNKTIIKTDNPDLAFAKLAQIIAPTYPKLAPGVNPLALVSKKSKIKNNVAIASFVTIEDDVEIADNTAIYPGSYIGYGTKIGENVLIYPNVTIREKSIIGNNVIIHSGTVIGSDGFGYVNTGTSHYKIPQIGIVEIEDDVEIGANVTIDRARFGKTVIGAGTKIDNLVQIAHNVVIGKNCIIIAQVGISGSTKIGDNTIIAGQVGIVGHIEIGKNVVIAAQAGVTKSVEDGVFMIGSPAKPHDLWKKINALMQRLPKLYETVSNIEKQLGKSEENNSGETENNKR